MIFVFVVHGLPQIISILNQTNNQANNIEYLMYFMKVICKQLLIIIIKKRLLIIVMKFNNTNPRSIRKLARRLKLAVKLMRHRKQKQKMELKQNTSKLSNPENIQSKNQLVIQANKSSIAQKQNVIDGVGNKSLPLVQSKKVDAQVSKVQSQSIKRNIINKIDRKQQSKNKQQINEMQDESYIALDKLQQQNSQKPAWYFSDKKFIDFTLSQPTLKALSKNNYQTMTHIQARTLPHLLRGKDVLGSAKTGSGKTLAYLIPCFQKLRQLEFKQINGTGVIVILPTRQLALQVFDVAKKLGEFHNKTIGLLIGGMNRKMEKIRLEKGVNLLICTPGRLLDHLQNSNFIYHNLFSLIIDEADALLKIGFEQQISDILKALPKDRQTVLFSATQTRKIEDLAKLSLQNPLYIGVDDTNLQATVETLEQGFVVINAANKFRLLLTFLRKQKNKQQKIMVFFSSCNSVKFYSDLLNYIDISVMQIHGKQKQQKRSTTFYEFSQLKQGILLCTDVAARGLDIPQVDWIVQYDPPLDIKEYIHRVGRTCRGFNSKGKALLILLEQQKGYLKHLLQAKVQLHEYEFDESKLQKVQQDFELLIEKNKYLHGEAINAFKSSLHAYTTYNIKQVFNVHSLDLNGVARSFGLTKPPHVDLNLKVGGSRARKLKELARK